MTIGEKIKARMKEKGLSQNELARRAGLSSSGISTIINGAFEPRMDNLRQIAQVLECQPGDLLDDNEYSPKYVLGNNVRIRRQALKMSQNALAKAAGVSQSAVSEIESIDGTKLPNVDTISKIASALECSVDDLLNGDTKKAQEIPSDPLRASIIRDYDLLPPEAQRLVRQYIDLLSKR